LFFHFHVVPIAGSSNSENQYSSLDALSVRLMEAGAMGDQADNKHVQAPIPSLAEEEAIMKKKYGGLMPKKPPLISKDHERAFFDSADWALGKGGAPPGQKPRSLMETLRPKLQPSHHHSAPSRRSSLLAADNEGEGHVDGEGHRMSDEPVNNVNGVPSQS
jgi:hypothetical protein